jgi:hypothetical protein
MLDLKTRRAIHHALAALTLLNLFLPPTQAYAEVGSGKTTATESGSRDGRLLGIRLRPKVLILLQEVEKLYGRVVEAEFADISESSEGGDTAGKAIITDDGRPTIKVDKHVNPKDTNRVEAIIAHELLHLRLRAMRYPVLYFHGETGLMESVGPYLLAAGNGLRNGIEHWMFIPAMKAMGFASVSEIRIGAEKFGSAAKTGRGDDVLLALYYYRATIEYENPVQLSELRREYVEGGRSGVVKLGERLAQIVYENNPRTPDEVAKTLLSCLDALFQKQIVFTLLPSTEKTSGSVVLKRINLQVTKGSRSGFHYHRRGRWWGKVGAGRPASRQISPKTSNTWLRV